MKEDNIFKGLIPCDENDVTLYKRTVGYMMLE